MFPSFALIIGIVFAAVFLYGTLGLWWLDSTRLKIARQLVTEGAPLVDVDAPAVFARDHLKNAINIPLGELDRRANELDRNRPVVVYGRGRLRAARAAHALRALGFHDVVSMGTARYEL